MPKRISQNELDTVQQAVGRFPEGAGIEEINKVLSIRLSRRTLQRRLALLVEQKQIIIEGRARASRYRLPGIAINGNFGLKAAVHAEVYVAISPEGEEIKKAVRKPIQNRHPVGYNRAFLDSYHPNDTFFHLKFENSFTRLDNLHKANIRQEPMPGRFLIDC